MEKITNAEMFAWGEAQRARASHMNNTQLAAALLNEPMWMIGTAEAELSVDISDAMGVVREAAYRLAGVRDYVRKSDGND